MKTLITAILFALSFTCIAQDDSSNAAPLPDPRLIRFDTAIVVPMTPIFGLERRAEFRGFFLNYDSKALALRWRITYYRAGSPVKLFGRDSEDREQIAGMGTFVNLQGNIIDTAGHAGPFMHEYEFYLYVAENGAINPMTGQPLKINDMIRQAGVRWAQRQEN